MTLMVWRMNLWNHRYSSCLKIYFWGICAKWLQLHFIGVYNSGVPMWFIGTRILAASNVSRESSLNEHTKILRQGRQQNKHAPVTRSAINDRHAFHFSRPCSRLWWFASVSSCSVCVCSFKWELSQSPPLLAVHYSATCSARILFLLHQGCKAQGAVVGAWRCSI